MTGGLLIAGIELIPKKRKPQQVVLKLASETIAWGKETDMSKTVFAGLSDVQSALLETVSQEPRLVHAANAGQSRALKMKRRYYLS